MFLRGFICVILLTIESSLELAVFVLCFPTEFNSNEPNYWCTVHNSKWMCHNIFYMKYYDLFSFTLLNLMSQYKIYRKLCQIKSSVIFSPNIYWNFQKYVLSLTNLPVQLCGFLLRICHHQSSKKMATLKQMSRAFALCLNWLSTFLINGGISKSV